MGFLPLQGAAVLLLLFFACGQGLADTPLTGLTPGLNQFYQSLDSDSDGQISLAEASSYIEHDIGGVEFDTRSEVQAGAKQVLQTLDSDDSDKTVDAHELDRQLQQVLNMTPTWDWVRHGLGLPEYAEAFRRHAVSPLDFPILVQDGGRVLAEDFSVRVSFHRQKLLRAMKRLMLGLGRAPGSPTVSMCRLRGHQATLSWEAPAELGQPALHKYCVERQSVDSKWSVIAELEEATSFSENLPPNVSAYYRVVAWNMYGRSVPTAMLCEGDTERLALCPVPSPLLPGAATLAAGAIEVMPRSAGDASASSGSRMRGVRLSAGQGYGASQMAAAVASQLNSLLLLVLPLLLRLVPPSLLLRFQHVLRQSLHGLTQRIARAPAAPTAPAVPAGSAAGALEGIAGTASLPAGAGSTVGSSSFGRLRSATSGNSTVQAGYAAEPPHVIHRLASATRTEHANGYKGIIPQSTMAPFTHGSPKAASVVVSRSTGLGGVAPELDSMISHQQRMTGCGLPPLMQRLNAMADTHLAMAGGVGMAAVGGSSPRRHQHEVVMSPGGPVAAMPNNYVRQGTVMATSRDSPGQCSYDGCTRKLDSILQYKEWKSKHYCGRCQKTYCLGHTAFSPHGVTGSCGQDSKCVCVTCFTHFRPEYQEYLRTRNTLPQQTTQPQPPAPRSASVQHAAAGQAASRQQRQAQHAHLPHLQAEGPSSTDSMASLAAQQQLQQHAEARKLWGRALRKLKAVVRFKQGVKLHEQQPVAPVSETPEDLQPARNTT